MAHSLSQITGCIIVTSYKAHQVMRCDNISFIEKGHLWRSRWCAVTHQGCQDAPKHRGTGSDGTLLCWQVLMDVCAKFFWPMRYDAAPMHDEAGDAAGARRKLRNSASGHASRDLGRIRCEGLSSDEPGTSGPRAADR